MHNHMNHPFGEGNLNSGERFVMKVNHTGNQVDAVSLIRVIDQSALKDHAVLVVTGRDLTIKPPNWVFGAASLGKSYAVISVHRFQDLPYEDRKIALRRTFRHELGHILGMARDLKRPYTVEDSGPHCTHDVCAMRQTHGMKELLMAAKAEETSGQYYCQDCLMDYHKHMKTPGA